ncbi:alkaline phosphatase [Aliagarivorans marinus]|uniref:alkaline phosphatase n=1 Tax=Aliagarivorans marinus TaxID=561965 RepID=UPI0003FBBA78|nr:alkaline phosphatase [Aliagarivorans marinus]
MKLAKLNKLTLALGMSAGIVLTGCGSSSSDNDGDRDVRAKNVILMVTDGASDGAWDIAAYWQHGQLANSVEPYSLIDTRYAMTTFPLNTRSNPEELCDAGEDGVREVSYDKSKVWDDTPVADPDSRRPFEGYEYINKGATDSAAAGTALSAGIKTYNNALGVDYCGRPRQLITEIAKAQGLSTGVVSSVQFTHATPASFAAHNTSRNATLEISEYMLKEGLVDLIMGTGHPAYNGDGIERNPDNYEFRHVSEQNWQALHEGELVAKGQEEAWAFMDSKADFEALADGAADYRFMQAPLFALAQNDNTLQQGRSCQEGQDYYTAFDCDMIDNVPSLTTMTEGALNYLSQNPNGFFVMIEGGAVDWAAHANHTARIIEEQIDFDDSVAAVIKWVEENSSWDETMLIVTTDHGNSYVLGEASDQVAYAAVESAGIEKMPEVKYYSGSHTNELVRVYVKGVGEDMFAQHFDGKDEKYAEMYQNEGATGDYFDNTNIFDVMKEFIIE